MKKAFAILLALSLLLGMTGTVLADDWITVRVETYDREITGLDVTDCWQLRYAQEPSAIPTTSNWTSSPMPGGPKATC